MQMAGTKVEKKRNKINPQSLFLHGYSPISLQRSRSLGLQHNKSKKRTNLESDTNMKQNCGRAAKAKKEGKTFVSCPSSRMGGKLLLRTFERKEALLHLMWRVSPPTLNFRFSRTKGGAKKKGLLRCRRGGDDSA